MRKRHLQAVLMVVLSLWGQIWRAPAHAQSMAGDFAAGARINLIVGFEAGGIYDIYARIIAPYLTKHLRNHPQVVVQNMVGAGSLNAANHLYNVAPKDGSTLAMLGQGIAQMELFAQPGILFQADKFNWIGRMSDARSLIISSEQSGVRSIEDALNKPFTVSVGGPISGSTLYVLFLNKLVGTKMQAIRGYTPSQAMLAMERGEVDGLASILWSNLHTTYGHLLAARKVNVLVQVGTVRDPNLPDVPLMSELARSDSDRVLLDMIASSDIIGRTIVAPPNVPAERVDILREAMMRALHDTELLEAATKLGAEISPLNGVDLQAMIADSMKAPKPVIERIRSVIAEVGK